MRLYSLPAIFICELKTEIFSPSTSVQTKPTEWVHLKREHDLTFNLSICQFYRLLKWSRNIKKSEKGLLFESWSRWRGHFFWLTLVVTHTCIGSGCKHRVKYKPLWLRNFLDYVFLSGKVFPIWIMFTCLSLLQNTFPRTQSIIIEMKMPQPMKVNGYNGVILENGC